jgi:hypothetical protein
MADDGRGVHAGARRGRGAVQRAVLSIIGALLFFFRRRSTTTGALLLLRGARAAWSAAARRSDRPLRLPPELIPVTFAALIVAALWDGRLGAGRSRSCSPPDRRPDALPRGDGRSRRRSAARRRRSACASCSGGSKTWHFISIVSRRLHRRRHHDGAAARRAAWRSRLVDRGGGSPTRSSPRCSRSASCRCSRRSPASPPTRRCWSSRT